MKKPVKGKPVPKAKTHHHAKPVTRAVRTARHSAAVKAAKTRAANARKAKVHPRRKLALGEGVACCSAEALAASLRLAGAPVSDEDVLALYWRTAADADAGASIWATLEAAARFGLAGCRPDFKEVMPREPGQQCLRCWSRTYAAGLSGVTRAGQVPLLLGADLPGPHAVLATPDGWWSWGELYDPACWPDAVIEEAWTIEWEVGAP